MKKNEPKFLEKEFEECFEKLSDNIKLDLSTALFNIVSNATKSEIINVLTNGDLKTQIKNNQQL
tara:strand:+ start:26 stop:217 length:192 start_codon:yes stop_codon:yes gene_type:complete